MKNLNLMKKIAFISLALLCMLLINSSARAQASITSGTRVNQNFDSIGTSAIATLPPGFRVDKQTVERTVGTYAAAGTATELRGGNNLATNAANGIYNFGAGDPAAATDRAVGFLSSGSATKSGNLYLRLQNTSATTTITSLGINYDVEKYRNGTNVAGYTIQLFTSTDDVAYTSAGATFTTSFPADANNSGFTPAPGATVRVGGTITVSIPPGGSFYLAWNYSVTTGSITSNAQALAIDNISIGADLGPTASNGLIGGRISNSSGRGIRNVRLMLAGGSLTEPIYVYSTSFGYYQFPEVPTGQTYIVTVNAKRYTFNPSSILVNLSDSLDDIDFVGEEGLIQNLQRW